MLNNTKSLKQKSVLRESIEVVSEFIQGGVNRLRGKDRAMVSHYIESAPKVNTVADFSALQSPILSRVVEGREALLVGALRKANSSSSEWRATYAQNLTLNVIEKLLDLDPTTVRAHHFIDKCGSVDDVDPLVRVRGVKFLINLQSMILAKVGELQASPDIATKLSAGQWLGVMTAVLGKIGSVARNDGTEFATKASSYAARFLKESGVTIHWSPSNLFDCD